MIFAREISDSLTSLVKKLDAATAKNSDCSMGSFVVFCSDKEELEKDLKALIEKQGIKNTVLTIDNPAGPKGYDLAKEADVTIVLYTEKVVKANYAFEKGKMTAKDVEKIVKDVEKILPKK